MSYTARQIIRVARKMGYETHEGAKHTLVFDPKTGRRISTIPRGFIPKGTFRAILKQVGITETEFKKLL